MWSTARLTRASAVAKRERDLERETPDLVHLEASHRPARERVRGADWRALDQAQDERDATQRLAALVSELERAGYASAARCLADDLDALVVHLRYPL